MSDATLATPTAAVKTVYTAHQGNVVGQSDDEKQIVASSPADALRQALEWAAESDWPSEVSYAAVVWVEDHDGSVVAQQAVVVEDGSPSW